MPLAYDDVRHLVGQPESDTLELKASVPRPSDIARLVAGLANTSGGVILFGVNEGRSFTERLAGIDEGRLRQAVTRAQMLLRPSPRLSLSVFELEGKHVGALEVASPPGVLTTIEGQVWARVGDRTVPAAAAQIVHRVQVPSESVADRSETVERLAGLVARQGRLIEELRSTNTAHRQSTWITIAGLIGFGIGLAVAAMFT